MFSAVYIEEEIAGHPRVEKILARFPDLPVISCQRYGELFNRKAQNFRLQKQAPALILARKHGNLVLPAPAGYGFDSGESFYFSHMLNCIYDCRYCFLQGMYRSAHYVLFINYEDFAVALLDQISSSDGPSVYYSGYDCDSLALEPVSGFCAFFLPLFRSRSEATLEIRTKSTQIRELLQAEPSANCVIAMSFTAHEAAQRWEHRVPAIAKRIEALQRLQEAGWPVAIRFEPLLFEQGMLDAYRRLFEEVFSQLDVKAVHSVSTGEFRMPADFYRNLVRLYPDEALFARETEARGGMIALTAGGEQSVAELERLLLGFISPEQYYRCA